MSVQSIKQRLDEVYKASPISQISLGFKALVISDSHWGVRDNADDFKLNDLSFRQVLMQYFTKGFTLILPGDTWDLWENPKIQDIIKVYEVAWELIQNYKKANRLILILGNHNPDPSLPLAVRLQYPDGKEIFITHGHAGDWTCETESRWAKIFVRYVWAGIGQRVFGLPDPTSARAEGNPQKHIETRQAFTEWANENKRLTIYGHTHFQENVGFAFNSGCYIGQHREGITIIEGKISLANFT